ncbi:MAG: glycoside hydrolase family 30 protein [Saprospiraceae bacterium]|nr:glycoside hydrolase family 30 protein [Saprospiraceae bacterium]
MLNNFKYVLSRVGFMAIICVNAQSKLNRDVSVYVTSENTSKRMEKVDAQDYIKTYQPVENEVCIFVDSLSKFQKFVGIGGAFTDAAAETFYKLSPEKRKEFITMYFDEKFGIGYSFGRTNINSCDFSSDTYSYVTDGDKSLETFNIEHDRRYKIPLIREALKATNGKLKIFASPWSPPAYMKDNANMLQGGKLLPDFYKIWAKYYVRFIKEYEKDGIPIWGLSVQNEPMAKQTWESCIYSAEDELNFIKNYLGPELYKSKMQNKKLIAWDHNRDLLYHRANTLLHDKKASKYIWGIGFHWYEIWNGGRQYDNVRRVKEAFPATNLLLTEACNYPFDWNTFDQWKWGEQYGENMIQDFNNGAVAWTDWNILLDETGGPNHVGNFCFAPVHARTHENSLHMMNSYYYIGHFSKFIRPGARRIAVSSNRAQLLATGFKNPDGSVAVVIMNKTEEDFEYKLFIGNQALPVKISKHSIMTIVI